MLSAPTGSVYLVLVEPLRFLLSGGGISGGVSCKRMRGRKVAFSLDFLEESWTWFAVDLPWGQMG